MRVISGFTLRIKAIVTGSPSKLLLPLCQEISDSTLLDATLNFELAVGSVSTI